MSEASPCDRTYIYDSSLSPFLSSSSSRARQSIHTVISPFYFHLDRIAITCSIQYAKFKLKLAYMVSMSAEGSSLPPTMITLFPFSPMCPGMCHLVRKTSYPVSSSYPRS
ncbi:hypothetical protein VN97_g9111 [Penicillium thymicola]|uniref:Uncharacterized protein n=1 Tax=Penicillium thymicola TaxID=293382 RepID=A0AAI9TBH4_PENTH|nr:hypothetical protein VN97_g9111 [Penicillium thymicola]